jgi:hypothetical protein
MCHKVTCPHLTRKPIAVREPIAESRVVGEPIVESRVVGEPLKQVGKYLYKYQGTPNNVTLPRRDKVGLSSPSTLKTSTTPPAAAKEGGSSSPLRLMHQLVGFLGAISRRILGARIGSG